MNSSAMAGPSYGSQQQFQHQMSTYGYSHDVVADFGVPLQHAETETQPPPQAQLDATDNFLYSQLQNPDHAHYSAIQAKKQRIKERAGSAKQESALKAAAAEAQREAKEQAKAAREQAKAAKERAKAAKEQAKAANEPILYKLGKDLMVSDGEFLERSLVSYQR